MMTEKKIIVCIPTYRRADDLRALLQSLAVQSRLPDRVIVADNEGVNGQGFGVVNAMKDAFPVPLTVIPAIEKGVSAVRNAFLLEAFNTYAADAIAMIDDDMTAHKDWIKELLNMWNETGAMVIGSRVEPVFDIAPPPAWTIRLPTYYRRRPHNGTCPIVYGAGGTFITRSSLVPPALFDLNFGLTGSEDEEFFMRLKKAGATFAFSQAAISYERITPERTQKNWVYARVFRIGAGHMRVLRLHPPTLKESVVELRKLLIGFGALLAAPFLIWHPMYHVLAICYFVNACGKLYGLMGKQPKGYDVQ